MDLAQPGKQDTDVLAIMIACIADPRKWPEALARLKFSHGLSIELEATKFAGEMASRTAQDLTISAVRKRTAERAMEESSRLARLRLRKTIELCQHIEGLQAQKDAAMQALDRVDRGVLLVDAASKLIMSNATASAILKQKDGLSIERECLTAARTNETRVMREMVRNAANPGPDGAEERQGAMTVTRPSLKRMLTLLIMPCCCGVATSNEEYRKLALVHLNDPETQLCVDPTALSRMYGLTRAEAGLALELLRGKSAEEAADALFVSIKTVRTHLHRIFLKTETNRQSQLLQLLMRSMS